MVTINDIPLGWLILVLIFYKIAETIFMIEIYNKYIKIKDRVKKKRWQKTI